MSWPISAVKVALTIFGTTLFYPQIKKHNIKKKVMIEFENNFYS